MSIPQPQDHAPGEPVEINHDRFCDPITDPADDPESDVVVVKIIMEDVLLMEPFGTLPPPSKKD